MTYVANFIQTSKNTSTMEVSGPAGITSIEEIVSCPRLMADQRGIELSLFCADHGITVKDVYVTGIENKHERNWVIYQAKNWRSCLNEYLTEYNDAQQKYKDSKLN